MCRRWFSRLTDMWTVSKFSSILKYNELKDMGMLHYLNVPQHGPNDWKIWYNVLIESVGRCIPAFDDYEGACVLLTKATLILTKNNITTDCLWGQEQSNTKNSLVDDYIHGTKQLRYKKKLKSMTTYMEQSNLDIKKNSNRWLHTWNKATEI